MVSVDVKHHVCLLTPPYPLIPSISPSLISLMVSVDVKHHVNYLLHLHTPLPLSPSLISLTVSVDNKHHVYLPTPPYPPPPPQHFSPSPISLMVSMDVKHHVYFKFRFKIQIQKTFLSVAIRTIKRIFNK